MASELETYAAIVWEPDDLIEIRSFFADGKDNRPKTPNNELRFWCKAFGLAAHLPRLVDGNFISGRPVEQNSHIFAGILPRLCDGGGKAEHVAGGRVLWADFDDCTAEEAVEIAGRLELPIASMAVFSGHGAHLFWRLKECADRDTLAAAMHRFTDWLHAQPESHVDASAKDPARILRLPGFINHKAPAARAGILYSDADTRYVLDDFAAFALPQTENAPAVAPSGGDTLTERARRYLAMIPGSGPGGRTKTAFRAAAVMVNDIGLSEADAAQLLAGWDVGANSPCIAQDYGPDEIRKIVTNAARYHKKAPGCLNVPQAPIAESEVVDGVDFSGFMKRKMAALEPFPSEFLNVPGFMAEVMNFNLESAPKPQPVLALAGAIVLQAVLCARKLTDEAGTRPNLYVCGVAESGAGKDHARQLNKRILMEAGLSQLQAEGIKSGSGLVNALVIQPGLLFQIDEYGRFIKTANNQSKNPHSYEIISKLLGLYSSSGGVYESDRYADKDAGGKQIKDPHAILYGTTVPRSLYEGLSEESVTDGFLSRTLIFDVDGNNPMRRRVKTSPTPAPIIERARWWGDFNPGGGNMNPEARTVPITTEADAIAEAFIETEHREQEKLKGSPLATLWTRTAQNADKLALIYAASKAPESPKVDAEAARWGYGLAEWLTRRMVTIIGDNVADNPFQAEALRLRRILKREGGELTREVLIRKMKIKARDLDDVITFMCEIGELRVVNIDTAGRCKTVYRLVG